MIKILLILLSLTISINTFAISERKLAKIEEFNSDKSHYLSIRASRSSAGVNGVNIPKSFVMNSAPNLDSKRLTVYGYEIAIVSNNVFTGLYGIRVTFKSDGDWVYLTEPTFDEASISTTEKADETFRAAVAVINQAAYEILRPDDGGGVVVIPEFGIERIDYLIGQLTVVSDEIKVNE